jgi:tetratricopeptide (TPR) repeat protein
LKPFTAASSSQLTLFKLTGKDSPFERDLYRFEPAEGGVTTDYVQYFILIKDGQAAHPLKGQADADGVGAAPPVVVKTWPEAGSTDVSPDLGEIRVTFSKTMRDRSWSWCIADQGLFPIGQPRYDSDRRTCVLKVKLKPDTIYAMWLNRDEYKNFQDVAGNPSVPYLWVFKTAGDPPRSIAENIAAYIYDGNAAVLAHDYDSAIATFRKALSLANPKSSQAGEIRLRIGETYRQNGELDRSITTLQEARELAPDNVTLLCTLALALDGAGRVPEAQEAYEDVLRRDPDQGVALNNLAYLLSEHGGDLDKALAYAQRAQTLLPGRFEVSDTLGWIYLKKGQPAEAVPVFRDLVQKSPSPPTYRYHLAMALQKTGDPVSAARELKEALQHNPSKTEEHEIRELLQNLRQ